MKKRFSWLVLYFIDTGQTFASFGNLFKHSAFDDEMLFLLAVDCSNTPIKKEQNKKSKNNDRIFVIDMYPNVS